MIVRFAMKWMLSVVAVLLLIGCGSVDHDEFNPGLLQMLPESDKIVESHISGISTWSFATDLSMNQILEFLDIELGTTWQRQPPVVDIHKMRGFFADATTLDSLTMFNGSKNPAQYLGVAVVKEDTEGRKAMATFTLMNLKKI